MAESLAGVGLHYVDSVKKAEDFLRWLSERRPDDFIAVDTETGEVPGNPKNHAFSPWHGRLRLVQVGDGMNGWAIPWDRWNGVFHEGMQRYTGEIIFHNVAFEYRWFEKHSDFHIPWERSHDTMIAAQIINPLQSVALKSLTSKYIDGKAAALQRLLDEKMVENGWTWGTVPLTVREYWSYGALDTVLTARLWGHLLPEIGPYKGVYDIEMAVRRVCSRMEMNGARVDVEYCKEQYGILNDHARGIAEWVKDAYGANAGSTKQMVKVFCEDLGGMITEVTAGGAPRLDKVQLKKFTIEDPGGTRGVLAEKLLSMRKASKLADSYFLNFINDELDGLLYPQIRTLGARTGRMSITSPALQTLPKRDKIVRKAFIPRTEDEVILSCDLEQIEFRMMAALSGDPALVSLFNECDLTGDDAFTRIGQEVYGDPSMSKDDPRRNPIKTYIYGTLYGAGIPKSAINAGVPEERMRMLAASFNDKYPGVKTFMQTVEHRGMTRFRDEGEAYVFTKFGRRLPADEGRVYTLVNYLIQGGAAEIFKYDLLKADAAGLGEYFIVPVHDELVLSVPKKDAEEIGRVLQECMTTRDGWAVPLLAGSPSVGDRWGDLSA